MAGGAVVDDGSTYTSKVAFMYVFNLIVGTGALALPSVLTSGGWVLGTLFLVLVAFSSYIGVTFVIESMAAANAVLCQEASGKTSLTEDSAELVTLVEGGGGGGGDSVSSGSIKATGAASALTSTAAGIPVRSAAVSPFEIVQKTEMGQMADLFFNDTGRIFFYIALICYLFGDAAIYCTFIPRSLVGFVYGEAAAPPWAFDLFLGVFAVVIVPFCFFDFQKTKPLQMITMVIRNAALFTMIVLAIWLSVTRGPRTKGVPNFRASALPNLFGGAVYAFMCHHSLPGIITPVRNKALISTLLQAAFVCVFTIYILLFVSCGIAFGLGAEDPITFNFNPQKFGLVGDFLYLFPVFTLSSNYPMLTITLRNNLDTLLHLILPRGTSLLPSVAGFSPRPSSLSKAHHHHHHHHLIRPSTPDAASLASSSAALHSAGRLRRFVVTCIAVLPPILFCLAAEHAGVDVSSLVGLTGAYAGAAVMFIIPACLVHCSRILVNDQIPAGDDSSPRSDDGLSSSSTSLRVLSYHRWAPHRANLHASPFRSHRWVVALIVLAVLAIVFITVDELVEVGGGAGR